MPAPRLMLFDMDDVLCHYDWPGRVAALARLAGLAGDAHPDDIWDADLEDRADRGEIDASEYLARFGSRLGLSLSRAQWIENRRAAMMRWPDMLALALFGFSAHETLFTDDRAENVDGAIAAGLMGHVHAGPDALRTRLAEIGLPIST